MAKGGAKDSANYTKWKAAGYLEEVDKTTGTAIADFLESGEIVFKSDPDFKSDVIRTGMGDISFKKDEIIFESIVDFYVQKNDPLLVIDYNDIYSKLKTAISERAVKMFDADQKTGDNEPFFDPVNQHCFKEWFVNYYIESSKSKGGK